MNKKFLYGVILLISTTSRLPALHKAASVGTEAVTATVRSQATQQTETKTTHAVASASAGDSKQTSADAITQEKAWTKCYVIPL